MKASGFFRGAAPAMLVAAALALAGCETMSSMWSSMFGGSTVTLSGGQEVPTVATSAAGKGTITVKSDKSVSGNITTSAVNGTAAHIHTGAAGQNGLALAVAYGVAFIVDRVAGPAG